MRIRARTVEMHNLGANDLKPSPSQDVQLDRHVGKMFVQFFDGVLAAWVRGTSTLCILQPTCGEGVALEHNGDVYSCDHFVEPGYLLGNVTETPLPELVNSEKQRRFGDLF